MTKTCPVCRNGFEPKRESQKYCCKTCALKHAHEEEHKRYGHANCAICGKKFLKKSKYQKYCSRKCAQAEVNTEHFVKHGLTEKYDLKKAKRSHKDLVKTNRQARQAGMSYGKWVSYQQRIGNVLQNAI